MLAYVGRAIVLISVFIFLLYDIPTKYFCIQPLIYSLMLVIETLIILTERPRYITQLTIETLPVFVILFTAGIALVTETNRNTVVRAFMANSFMVYTGAIILVNCINMSRNELKRYILMYDNQRSPGFLLSCKCFSRIIIDYTKAYISLLAAVSMYYDDYLTAFGYLMRYFGFFTAVLCLICVIVSGETYIMSQFALVTLITSISQILILCSNVRLCLAYTFLAHGIDYTILAVKEIFFTKVTETTDDYTQI